MTFRSFRCWVSAGCSMLSLVQYDKVLSALKSIQGSSVIVGNKNIKLVLNVLLALAKTVGQDACDAKVTRSLNVHPRSCFHAQHLLLYHTPIPLYIHSRVIPLLLGLSLRAAFCTGVCPVLRLVSANSRCPTRICLTVSL
jgi:hypothetical protein